MESNLYLLPNLMLYSVVLLEYLYLLPNLILYSVVLLECVYFNTIEYLLDIPIYFFFFQDESVEDSNSVCNECEEKIQSAFDFKSCIVNTVIVSENKSQILHIIEDHPSTSVGESSAEKGVCCLCKSVVDTTAVISLAKVLKDDNVMEVFQGHIPEIVSVNFYIHVIFTIVHFVQGGWKRNGPFSGTALTSWNKAQPSIFNKGVLFSVIFDSATLRVGITPKFLNGIGSWVRFISKALTQFSI